MKVVKNICDFCGKETDSRDFFKVKVISDSFITYVNFDSLFSNREKFDICKDCIEEFRKWRECVN